MRNSNLNRRRSILKKNALRSNFQNFNVFKIFQLKPNASAIGVEMDRGGNNDGRPMPDVWTHPHASVTQLVRKACVDGAKIDWPYGRVCARRARAAYGCVTYAGGRAAGEGI